MSMNSANIQKMLEDIRGKALAEMAFDYHPELRNRYDVVRKARIVAMMFDYLGVNMPEARDLVGETQSLVSQLRTAEEVTPTLRHFI
jgi:hypothetical protein